MNNTSGIYKVKFKTRNYSYIGQTSIFSTVTCREHVTCNITTNNSNSAYALYNLNNRHEYGSMEDTMILLKTCTKRLKINCFLYKPTSNGAN